MRKLHEYADQLGQDIEKEQDAQIVCAIREELYLLLQLISRQIYLHDSDEENWIKQSKNHIQKARNPQPK